MKAHYERRTLKVVLIGTVIILLCFIVHFTLHSKNVDYEKTVSIAPINKKLFVYLLQTEQCIPDYFITGNQLLGDPDECRCDVLVFSFKEKCLNSSLSHIEHIYSTPSTLNTGKNLIYKAAQDRKVDYLYYVFADDDVKLSYHEKYTPVEMKSISPWRAFENFLIEHEPAVGGPNYFFHHNSEITIQSYQETCLPHINAPETLAPNRTYIGTEMPLYLTVVHFDAMFNAYHRDAVGALLPFMTLFDGDWAYSQMYQVVNVELTFRGHAVMFTPVKADNPIHREYPRSGLPFVEAYRKMITQISQDIPFQFSKDGYIQQFYEDPVVYQEHSHTFCFKFPPKYPIKKYSHFPLNWNL